MGVPAAGIRVGVVGVGYWVSRHVRVPLSTTGVTTVIGVDQLFAQIGDGRWEPEYSIAACADIEKHVLIEKPMATTADVARTLVDAADAAGVVLMPGHRIGVRMSNRRRFIEIARSRLWPTACSCGY